MHPYLKYITNFIHFRTMKIFGKMIAVAALAMVSYSASAELAPQWTKGTMVVNATIGAEPTGANVSVDYVLVDEWWKGHFTVGGDLGLSNRKYNNLIDEKNNYIGLTPRATYGLNITDKFEVHVVAGLGTIYNRWSYKDAMDNKVSNSEWYVYHTELAGCRFFFTDGIAVTAEMGYANNMPDFRVGLTFKL